MDPYDKESWELTGAKMVVVDGEKIKEDTYYRCIEGEIVSSLRSVRRQYLKIISKRLRMRLRWRKS